MPLVRPLHSSILLVLMAFALPALAQRASTTTTSTDPLAEVTRMFEAREPATAAAGTLRRTHSRQPSEAASIMRRAGTPPPRSPARCAPSSRPRSPSFTARSWATGLTTAYSRARCAVRSSRRCVQRGVRRRGRPTMPGPHAPAPRPHAILDPFHMYAQGEDLLRHELGALEAAHLRIILLAYDRAPDAETDLHLTREAVLVELIVAEVRAWAAR